jgi:glycosyltransferase A (GT-A) superfamily protein (DUF2064 family)
MLKEYLSSCQLLIFRGFIPAGEERNTDTRKETAIPQLPEGLSSLEIHLDPENQSDQIHKAFADAFATGKRKVGGLLSLPSGLEAKQLEEAFLSLRVLDACIGPDSSGGMYFLGLNSFDPSMLPADWNESRLCKVHTRRLGDLKKVLYRLPSL